VTLETSSVSPLGDSGDGPSESAEVSDDGRFVAFRSRATNLVASDTNGGWDVFVRDRSSGQTRRLNVRPDGSESPWSIDAPELSMTPSGSLVAFASADGLLAAGTHDDTNDALDVFVAATDSGSLRRVDLGWGPPIAGGLVPGNGPTWSPMLSVEGRSIVVQSKATNTQVPGPAGSTQVYAVDLPFDVVSRISINPDGSNPDRDCVQPQISANEAVVLFISPAMNLRGGVASELDRIYAAVHFDVTPVEAIVAGGGGQAEFTVTAEAHTNWWAMWDWSSYWFAPLAPPIGVGDGTLVFSAREFNPASTPRTMAVQVMSKSLAFTQAAGLSLTSVAPSSGPETGGTRVTLTGTGFEPDMRVVFGGVDAATEFVSSTTLVATTPPQAPSTVWVAVFAADGSRSGWIPDAFRYTDSTPPDLIAPFFFGEPGSNGWYTGPVTVNWAVGDSQSPITSSIGCGSTTVTEDTAGTTFTCTATSEGGTASASTTVKVDMTRPSVAIASPAPTVYTLNSVVATSFTCSDAVSGVAQCGLAAPSGAPFDTSSPGWQVFQTGALDAAGNSGGAAVEYAVSSGACLPVTPGVRLWFSFDGNTRENIHGSPFAAEKPSAPATYVAGTVGQAFALPGWQFVEFSHQLADVRFAGTMTFAAWLRADGQDGEAGTIVSKEDQFRIARFPDGTVRWAFANTNPGFVWVNTGVIIPAGVWTHVVVTYDHGVVKTYVNGRLVHTFDGAGDMQTIAGLPYWGRYVSFGNREDAAHKSFLIGAIDEVQMLDVVWDAATIESAFFAGAHGMCPLTRTVVLVANATATYGDATFVGRAQLRRAQDQQPIAGKPVRLVSRVKRDGSVAGTTTAVSDANGFVEGNVPIAPDAAAATYAFGLEAYFDADLEYGGSTGLGGEVTLRAGTPVVTWPAPAPIVYGTAIGLSQLNATANVPGVFWYSHTSGTVLNAGSHTLSVTFDPDSSNYANATSSVTLDVLKATPVISVSAGTFTYNGSARAATASAHGVNGVALTPVVVTYDGSATPPVNAGSYAVVGRYDGSANYIAASASATLTIAKAAPAVMWPSPSTISYGTALGAAQLNATANVPGSFSYAPAAGAILDAGARTLTATFTPSDTTNYSGATASTTLSVSKVTPSVTVNGGAFTYDGAPHPATGTVTGVAGATLGPLTLTYNGSSDAPLDAGTYSVVAAFAGDTNYNAASANATITIGKATPAVSWTQPAPIVYGTALGTAQLNASANVEGVLTYAPPAGTVLGAGAGQTLTATFVPADAVNYDGATKTTTIDVEKAQPSVTVTGGTFTYDGAAHPATGSVTGVGGAALGPLTFTYSGASSSPVGAGTYQVVASFAGDANYTGASSTSTITIGKASPALSWTRPGAIVYGTPLGAGQLNATANVAGSFGYTPGTGAILSSGSTQPLSAVFTPADPSNYIAGSVSTTIDVTPAPLTIRANDAMKPFGAPLPPFGASFTGLVNGDTPASLAGALGFATTAVAASPVGTYPIVASRLSSPNYATTFVAGSLTIVRDGVLVTVSTSPEPSGLDQPMTFTATVAAAPPGAGSPGGTVRFFDGTTLLGSATLTDGSATLTTAGLDAGSHAIDAQYDGDASFEPGAGSATHVVSAASATPSVALTSSRTTAASGVSVTWTATVTVATMGVVEFYDGGTLVAARPLSAGRATFTTSSLAIGSHAITARYSGAGGVPPAWSAVLVQIVTASGANLKNTTMSLVVTPNPAALGAPVDLVANVTGSTATKPTGRVLFMVDGAVVGDPAGEPVAPLSGSTARATLQLTTLAHGRHKVTATYLGDSKYKGSSGAVTSTVN